MASCDGQGCLVMLLQEYLASARKGGELGRTAGLPYRFCFFLHRHEGTGMEHEDHDGGQSLLVSLFVFLPTCPS
jgi:hypothetical protein